MTQVVNKPKNRIVIDWLRFVIPYAYDKSDSKLVLSNNNNPVKMYRVKTKQATNLIYAVANALSYDCKNFTNMTKSVYDTNKLNKAVFGYDKTIVLGHIKIMVKSITGLMQLSQINMGVCVELSSHALRDIEASKGFTSWYDWLQNLYELFPEIKISRIDLAADFFEDLGILKPFELFKISRHEQFNMPYQIVTRCKRGRFIGGSDLKTGVSVGDTFYLGERSSDYMLRVYDKYLERVNKHGDTWLKENAITDWIRYEFEIKNDLAKKVCSLIANGQSISDIWLNLLRRMFYIKATNEDEQTELEVQAFNPKQHKKIKKTVTDACKVWADFVNYSNVPKFDFSGKSPAYTYDRHMKWLGKSVMPSLTKDLMVHYLQGGDPRLFLSQLFEQSLSKLQPKDIDDVVKTLESALNSDFIKSGNKFEFTNEVSKVSDRVTGMIGQRLFDMRNGARLEHDDIKEIELQRYEDFVREFGLLPGINELVAAGIIHG